MSSSNTSKHDKAILALVNQYSTVEIEGHGIKVYRLSLRGVMALTRLLSKVISLLDAFSDEVSPERLSSLLLSAFGNSEQETIDIVKDALRIDDDDIVRGINPTALSKIITKVFEQEDIGEILNSFFAIVQRMGETLPKTGSP